MDQEQLLRLQGWSDERINKLKAVALHQDASQHLRQTGDLDGAYNLTLPKKKPEVDTLSELIESFAQERPNDAESLSIALTEFAEFVQSKVEKKAP